MRKVFILIGKLPFSGRHVIRDIVFMIWNHQEKKFFPCTFGLFILGILIFAHYIQLIMGLNAINFNNPFFFKIVSGIYVFLNFIVIIAQANIFLVVFLFLIGLRPFIKLKNTPRKYSKKIQNRDIAVTLAIQAAFLIPYIIYNQPVK